MARTIAEIKKEITDNYLSHDLIRKAYGLSEGDDFERKFSKVSLESILFYVFAFSVWTLDKIFDAHAGEVAERIASMKPGSLRWMVSKAKLFMPGYELVPDTDYYDYGNLGAEDVSELQVVKHAAAVENNAIVYLKVAGEKNGEPAPLSQEHQDGLEAYIREIKYAGVQVQIVNKEADHYRLRLVVYYDPKIINSQGNALLGGDPVRDAIRNFLRSLPFNSEYRNVDLIDTLQKLPGVVIPELIEAQTSPTGMDGSWRSIEAIALPDSGYYKIYDESDLTIDFRPYESVSN